MKYSPYPRYKSSGVEWLGDVPEHWEVKRLKFLSRESLKYGANESGTEYETDAIRYIRITDIDDEGNLLENTALYLPQSLAAEYLLKQGDILFARSGATVGKTFIYKESWGTACFAGYLIRLRANSDECIPDYLYYYTSTSAYWGWIVSIFSQSTIQNVSAEKYANLLVPVPPKDEQESIVGFLDQKTAEIDQLIEKREKLIKLLQEKREALITHAVTKGLDPTVKLKPSGVEWLGDVPEHWEVERLKYRVSVNDEVLSESTDPEYEILYVDIGNVDASKGIVDKELTEFRDAPSRARRRVKDGDTIVSTVRTYLRAIAPISDPEDNLVVSTGFAVVRPKYIDQNYLSYLLRSPYFVDSVVAKSDGVSYPAITPLELITIPIPTPLPTEQYAIAKFLDQKTVEIDQLIDNARQHIELLREYRTALISAAVTGKIDVREEVPVSEAMAVVE